MTSEMNPDHRDATRGAGRDGLAAVAVVVIAGLLIALLITQLV